ncbi:MAG: outer membrane lipoprotein carrier protein LolA [Lautropia sp.]|nr:outer membrane lipoprotein carrier protein LolA [Lautropia sp.]
MCDEWGWRAQSVPLARAGRLFFLVLALMMAAPHALAFDLPALQKQLQQSHEVHGEFTQQRFLTALSKPLVSSGQFQLVPGKSLLWHVQKPFEQKVRVDETGMQHWRNGRWQPDTRTGGAARAQLDFFMDMIGGRFDSLQKHFAIKLSGHEKQWKLQLDPSSVLMKKIFRRIDIDGDTHVRTVVLDEVQGDRVDMRFHALRRP